MSRVGEMIGGKFTLTALAGRSELGSVYAAETESGKKVALKLLHADLDTGITRALLTNAKAASKVRHARLARILGAKYSQAEHTYIVSEWLTGQNLGEFVKDSGPLTAARSANILIQICSALAPLHRLALPHANLKPNNVFMHQDDTGKDVVCLVDAVGSGVIGRQDDGELIGAVKHFSPAQLDGQVVDCSTDYFSIGILAYLLISGQYPFAAPTPSQTEELIRNVTYRPLKEIRATIPDGYCNFVEQCFARSPEDGFESLRKAAEALSVIAKLSESKPEAEAEAEAEEDPDSTMSFQVPAELQAYLDEHQPFADDEDVSESPDSNSAEPVDPTPTSSADQPFFTDVVDDDEMISVPTDTLTTSLGTEPSVGPGEELDDDLPFHSVSISQSLLEREASIIETEESLNTGLPLMPQGEHADNEDVTLGTPPPTQDLGGILESGHELETEDIMKALRSTIEAVGPGDLEQVSQSTAPLVDVSDFEELATGEFEHRAKNANRFFSTGAQTGLKRPVFTLFLLGVLAAAALIFQYEMEDADNQDHKLNQTLRKNRLEAIRRAKAQAAVEKPGTSQSTEKTSSDTKKGPELPVKTQTTPNTPKTTKEIPGQPKSTREIKRTRPSSSVNKRKPVNKTKSTPKAKPKKKKAPKVEIVDPFAQP